MAKQKTNRLVWGLAPILTGGLTLPGVSAPVTPADAPVGAQRPSAAKDSGKAPRHGFRSEEGWIETFHRTPLHYSVYAELGFWDLAPFPRERDAPLIAMKTEQPWALPSLNVQDAVRAGNDPIHTLLAHGAAVDAADVDGWTPLIRALKHWE